ncbi:MAG: hypothetical protein NVS1B5_05380 [Gemmatimonadaceae bacterium]
MDRVGPYQLTLAQTTHARASASTDSAIYAAFLETVNRDPERDTIYVEEMSTVFPGMSSHYDSVAILSHRLFGRRHRRQVFLLAVLRTYLRRRDCRVGTKRFHRKMGRSEDAILIIH